MVEIDPEHRRMTIRENGAVKWFTLEDPRAFKTLAKLWIGSVKNLTQWPGSWLKRVR